MAECLYLHVPFCRHICYYCDFTHVAYMEHMADQWLQALAKEISCKKINSNLTTIYIGEAVEIPEGEPERKKKPKKHKKLKANA